MHKRKAQIHLIVAMMIFGSIGLFVRNIPMESSMIALFRSVLGVLFLLTVMFARRIPICWEKIKDNFLILVISGTAMGFNWILLFESYRYTSVAVSTLCYYMAPIIVLLLSPILLKERLTRRKLLCIVIALAGMACISGVLQTGLSGNADLKGILLGLGAAVLYSSVVLLNKQLKGISAMERTVMQLGTAAVVLLPYCLLTCDLSQIAVGWTGWVLLAVVGFVHTGLSYYLYFGSMEHLSGQSIAICSYIDPVIAVLASVIVLREPFGIVDGIGATLILGAAVVSELPYNGKGGSA